jgi:16S rRNA (guanine527-N7)-methyltransferase
MNVVSRSSLEHLGEHLVDSSALLSIMDPAAGELADLGSGAGFPGMVVAIMRPQMRVTLVDSRRSKIVFLKDLQRRLGLSNVTVLHERLEELAGKREFAMTAARALGSIDRVLPHCLRLTADDGRLVLFKGPLWEEEQERAEAIAGREQSVISRVEKVALPGLDRVTTFVEFHVKRA